MPKMCQLFRVWKSVDLKVLSVTTMLKTWLQLGVLPAKPPERTPAQVRLPKSDLPQEEEPETLPGTTLRSRQHRMQLRNQERLLPKLSVAQTGKGFPFTQG